MAGQPPRRDDRPVFTARPEPELAWGLLGAAGLALAAVAVADLVLVWIPSQLDHGGWIFDTVTVVLDGLPPLVVGLALAYTAATARRSHIALRIASAVLLVLGLVVVGLFVLYMLRLPSALGSVEGPGRLGLTKAIIRTSTQAVVYSVACLWLGIKGWIDASRL
jgi:hypothetical protein